MSTYKSQAAQDAECAMCDESDGGEVHHYSYTETAHLGSYVFPLCDRCYSRSVTEFGPSFLTPRSTDRPSWSRQPS